MNCLNINELNNHIYKLIIIRIVLILFIFLNKSINLWTKIILIFSLDFIKNISLLFLCNKGKLPNLSDNELYQKSDKILDTVSYYICYYLLLTEVKNNNSLPKKFTNYLLYILLYRTIGIIYYLKTNNRKIFVYFPDLFKEALLLFYLFSFYLNKKTKTNTTLFYVLFILLIIIKINIEYRFHYTKDGLRYFLNFNTL